MKICDKHLVFFQTLKNDEDAIKVVSNFHEALNVLNDQDHIEIRKNKCQVCYYGALGRKTLVKMIKKYPNKKVRLLI